jgi:signal transduction histidine kinase
VELGWQGGPEAMMELGEVTAAWPFGASLAAAIAIRGLRAGRRRTAMNEALHELRRPLQALALATPGARPLAPAAIQGSVQMAASALERLEREINGEPAASRHAPFLARPLLAAAVDRWSRRASLAGASLALCWEAGEATIDGDRSEIAQALDNLIVNAIEHGGPEVVVEACAGPDRLRIAVLDRGLGSRPGGRLRSPAELIARLSGRRLRGHGLRIVRRIVAAHGGDFRLGSTDRGTEAVLGLPLSPPARCAR